MSPISISLLAIGLSVDALAASIGRGASGRRPTLGGALRTGAVFGAVEALTPILGWAMGVAAARYAQALYHWIAFALLGGVGLRMILHARRREADAPPDSGTGWPLIATAVGTSVDAMAVGASLAFLDVNILVVALAVGFSTMCMSAAGVLAGRFLGERFGRLAEMAGGATLVLLGVAILVDHLSAELAAGAPGLAASVARAASAVCGGRTCLPS